jgi:DNA-binding NarL/FixJ family response regulator
VTWASGAEEDEEALRTGVDRVSFVSVVFEDIASSGSLQTADDDQGTREELIQLGATGFVSKTNPGGLLRVVSAYVRPTKPPGA